MSKKNDGKLTCDCGGELEIEVYDSVNVNSDPDLKQKVLDREINSYTCPKCGTHFELKMKFLYHDDEKKHWIWVYPEQMRDDKENILKEIDDAYQAERPKMIYFGMNEPIDFVLVFGYDELLKKIS